MSFQPLNYVRCVCGGNAADGHACPERQDADRRRAVSFLVGSGLESDVLTPPPAQVAASVPPAAPGATESASGSPSACWVLSEAERAMRSERALHAEMGRALTTAVALRQERDDAIAALSEARAERDAARTAAALAVEEEARLRERQTYIRSELRDAAQYSNRDPLDRSGVWSLRRLTERVYAMGFDAGYRAGNQEIRTEMEFAELRKEGIDDE